jgi:hypothetical protein
MGNTKRIRHDQEIPQTEVKNCLKYYIAVAKREDKIVYINNFFGCTWFKVDSSMTLAQAYCKYQDRIEGREEDDDD